MGYNTYERIRASSQLYQRVNIDDLMCMQREDRSARCKETNPKFLAELQPRPQSQCAGLSVLESTHTFIAKIVLEVMNPGNPEVYSTIDHAKRYSCYHRILVYCTYNLGNLSDLFFSNVAAINPERWWLCVVMHNLARTSKWSVLRLRCDDVQIDLLHGEEEEESA